MIGLEMIGLVISGGAMTEAGGWPTPTECCCPPGAGGGLTGCGFGAGLAG